MRITGRPRRRVRRPRRTVPTERHAAPGRRGRRPLRGCVNATPLFSATCGSMWSSTPTGVCGSRNEPAVGCGVLDAPCQRNQTPHRVVEDADPYGGCINATPLFSATCGSMWSSTPTGVCESRKAPTGVCGSRNEPSVRHCILASTFSILHSQFQRWRFGAASARRPGTWW